MQGHGNKKVCCMNLEKKKRLLENLKLERERLSARIGRLSYDIMSEQYDESMQRIRRAGRNRQREAIFREMRVVWGK